MLEIRGNMGQGMFKVSLRTETLREIKENMG
jgi:hypothetical protein